MKKLTGKKQPKLKTLRTERIKEALAEERPEALLCDGHDDALLGIAERFGLLPVAAYDYDRVIGTLMRRDGMSREAAIEWFDFNIIGAYMGEGTPVFVRVNF